MCRILLLVVLVGWFDAGVANKVGTVINGIADYQRDVFFQNLAKQGRRFGSPNTPWDGKAKLDKNGWPVEDFGVILADANSKQLKDFVGTYTFSIQCNQNATVKMLVTHGYTLSTSWDASSKTVSGTVTFHSEPDMITPSFTNTGGGCRNLVFNMTTSFGKAINGLMEPALNMLKPFELVRYMPFTCTNDNPTVSWDQRVLPSSPSYAWSFIDSKICGASWEEIINIANTINRDVWVNIPAHANDDYINQMATLFKNRLSPHLNIYLEWSNEVWNGLFSQSGWNTQQAEDEVKAGDKLHFNYNGDNNKYYWGWRRTAYMIMKCGQMFQKVFGESGKPVNRIRPILAGQLGGETDKIGLEYLNAVWGKPDTMLWGVAVAPYFNPGKPKGGAFTSTQQILDGFEANIDEYRASSNVSSGIRLAQTAFNGAYYGLKVHSYEGGDATGAVVGHDSTKPELYKEAELTPRMKTLVETYLTNWYGWGFNPLNWFVCCASPWINSHDFTWGLTYDVLQPVTPKTQAIQHIQTGGTVPIRGGTLIPANNVNISLTQVGIRPDRVGPCWRWLNANTTGDWLINAPTASTYKLSFTSYGRKAGTVGVTVNNGDMQIVATSSQSTPTPSKPMSVNLHSGLNGMRFTVLCDQPSSNCGGNRAPYDICSYSITH